LYFEFYDHNLDKELVKRREKNVIILIALSAAPGLARFPSPLPLSARP